VKVIYGLLLSVLMGFFGGVAVVKLVEFIFRRVNRRKTYSTFKYAQIAGAAGMAFMHGAQDGQKFMGVFMLGLFLSQGSRMLPTLRYRSGLQCFVPLSWRSNVCGRHEDNKSVGMDMVKLETYQGFSADLVGALSIFTANVLGLPVSTTHTKTTAVMGVGAAKRITSVNGE
jgi:PiT family inorganic phosphate transporter